MLIFDPKSGQSVTLDLAAKPQRPADVPHVHAATKVPARASNISASLGNVCFTISLHKHSS
jgi:hypothetical protein